jgi:hypothetical protein
MPTDSETIGEVVERPSDQVHLRGACSYPAWILQAGLEDSLAAHVGLFFGRFIVYGF